MRNKDKKVIDRYMAKHPNAKPEKIEEYARKKGIHINVMAELEHRKLKAKMLNDLGIDEELDLDTARDQEKLQTAIENLSQDMKDAYMKEANDANK